MFALGIELLMRRAVITRWDKRDRPEWPPHPDRVFMALVAAYGEGGELAAERSALEWLETLGPPSLAVSRATSERAPFTSFVPINDDAAPVAKGKPLAPMGGLPIGRNRQPRHFPAVVPDEPLFHLVWPDAEIPAAIRPALDGLCGKVTYLGHSATPVRVGVTDQPGPITLAPTTEQASQRLRVFGPDRLKDLQARHEFQLRPQPTLWHGYAAPAATPKEEGAGPFDPGLIILRQVKGRVFALESAEMVARALRDELMRRHGPEAPEWLTGHPPGSQGPSQKTRPAWLPLGFVGRQHADGHLLGIAIALPTDFRPDDVQLLYRLLAQHREPEDVAVAGAGFVRLKIFKAGQAEVVGEMPLELDERPSPKRPYALQPETWTRAARHWATATPIVLPRYSRRRLTTEDVIRGACRDVGYPDPVEIRVGPTSVLEGVPHVKSFRRPPPKGPGRPPRPLFHAAITFAEPVAGPVLLGAGRYLGLGLCRPLPDGEETP